MHTKLRFSLNNDGVVRIHNAVQCLAKFSDTVSLEASRNRVRYSLLHPYFDVLISHFIPSLLCLH